MSCNNFPFWVGHHHTMIDAVSHAVAHTGKLPERAALAQHAQQLRLQANDLL